jgi:hypothetical protein
MLVFGDPQHFTLGRDDVGGEQVVHREAVLAHEPADAAAEGESGDPRVTYDAAGGRQTVDLRLVVDVAPQSTTLHPGGAADGVDPHGPHSREVDDDSVVTHGGAGHVVTAASYGDLHIVVACESHGGRHVSSAAAAGDESGVAVNGAVPYGSGVIVVGVVSGDELAPEPVDLHRSVLLAELADLSAVGLEDSCHPHLTTEPRGCIVLDLDFTDGSVSAMMRS